MAPAPIRRSRSSPASAVPKWACIIGSAANFSAFLRGRVRVAGGQPPCRFNGDAVASLVTAAALGACKARAVGPTTGTPGARHERERSMSENNEGPVIAANALIAKRADILFEIGDAEQRVERLRTRLVHLDAVLRMFPPRTSSGSDHCRYASAVLPSLPIFAHGELTKRIYDALRLKETITSAEVAAARDAGIKGLAPENDPDNPHGLRTARRIATQRHAAQREDRAARAWPARYTGGLRRPKTLNSWRAGASASPIRKRSWIRIGRAAFDDSLPKTPFACSGILGIVSRRAHHPSGS